MSNLVSVHLDASCTVEHHCDHVDGAVSLRIVDDSNGRLVCYLMGTLDELVRFADRIVDEVERLRGQANVADLLAEAERRRDERDRFEAVQ